MAQITKEITVDVARKNLFQAVVAKQSDYNSRFLKITLCNEGKKITVPSTAYATINAQRADGSSASFMGSVNPDGTVTAPLTSWMLTNGDVVACSISVIDTDEQKLTSTSFSIDVEAVESSGEDISEDENYDILITLISDVSEAKTACEEVTQNAIAVTEEAETATLAATRAAENADTATENANSATQNANDAASDAITAKDKAESAAQDAIAATENAKKATTAATKATQNADIATENANAATKAANDAATAANTAKSNAESATQDAIAATEEAETATLAATRAAENANTATENANIATQNASNAATDASTATENAATATQDAIAATEKAEAAVQAVEDRIGSIIITDASDDTMYLGKLKIVDGYPALSLAKI